MHSLYTWPGLFTPSSLRAFAPYLPALLAWEIFWKGLALWHSGRRGQATWFIVLIIVNTVGILPIIYLFAVAKLKFSELFTRKT